VVEAEAAEAHANNPSLPWPTTLQVPTDQSVGEATAVAAERVAAAEVEEVEALPSPKAYRLTKSWIGVPVSPIILCPLLPRHSLPPQHYRPGVLRGLRGKHRRLRQP